MTDNKQLLCFSEIYRDAIKSILNARKIVIYCGAGVSYALTGLTWNNLILDVAKRLEGDFKRFVGERTYKEQHSHLLNEIRQNVGNPSGNASLVASYIKQFRETNPFPYSVEDTLTKLIGDALYRLSVPSDNDAYLLSYISYLVVSLLRAKVEVVVVTTNYDSYLEEALRVGVELLNKDMHDNDEQVSVRIRSNVENYEPDSEHPELSILYLHGRIPLNRIPDTQPNGKSINNGKLVFSDIDYFESEKRTKKLLNRAADGADCFLILGSSLDDPPLVKWIQNNKRKQTPTNEPGNSVSSPKNTTVIVVQPIREEAYEEPALTDSDRKIYAGLKNRRYALLGVDYYIPVRCYIDIALLIRDSIVSRKTIESDKPYTSATYTDLSKWSTSISGNINDPSRSLSLYEALSRNAEFVGSALSKLIAFSRVFTTKIEFWIRGAVPREGDPSYLVKVADSSGIVLNPSTRRVESYLRRFPSRSAALRALQIGRAELVTLRTLGLPDSASRWQAFYSTPIFGMLGDSGLRVPAGVGSVVVAMKLAENSPNEITKDIRLRFADIADSLSHSIQTGTIDQEQRGYLERLRLMVNLIVQDVMRESQLKDS